MTDHHTTKRWDVQANLHLMAYLMRQARSGIHYASERMRAYPMPAQSDHETTELMRPLVDAKTYWAQDMREHEAVSGIPADGGKSLWSEYVEAAESRIADLRARATA